MDNNNPDPWAAYRRPPPESTEDAVDSVSLPVTVPSPPPIPASVPQEPAPVTPPLFPYAQPHQPPVDDPLPPRRWPALLQSLAAGVVGAVVLAGVLWTTGVFDDPDPVIMQAPPGGVVEIREVVTDGGATNASAVARKVVPSIVTVDVGVDDDGTFERFGSGSGVVLSSNGLIATNAHVIDGADRVQVVFSNGRIYEARIVGADARTDLAVLEVTAAGLTPIEIGSTDTAQIGQVAIAIGSPLGLEGGPSVTMGVLSAFGRRVETGPGETDILFDMIQTDAPITQGSSGGALVDENGQLLGITSAIGVSSAGAEGIGFAIPAELVTRITNEIIETGDVEHAFLGVTLGVAFDEAVDGAQIPAGALVIDFPVEPSAARLAGVEEGDLIIGYNDSEVATQEHLISGLRRLRVGDTVTLKVVRGSDVLDIDVILDARPGDL